ncbi:NAD(P)-binding protein [Periconia macrospinosa]|uniref:NAD(P)-binding protein n=1 Tax=Periconia macrospinosa TaxID=97972 RepID=A0A2V1D9V2_9PLEO|nr:NAD(P)-binding protein [Periconia macrospinosa]
MSTSTPLPTFTAETTSEQVCESLSPQISNKTILITGVSPNGLGLTTALALSTHSPRLLILAGRSPTALSTSLDTIKSQAPSCPVRTLQLDLSSFAKVREAAAEVREWEEVKQHGIDVLINNAGIMSVPWGKTADGIETQFAVNHLGPWLFTNLVMEAVKKARGRVVFLASLGHVYGGVRWEDVNFEDGKAYDPDTAYGQSKTANILTAIALSQSPSLNAAGVSAFSVHPGLVLTNLSSHIPMQVFKDKGFVDDEGKLLVPSKTHSQGAATTLVAAFDPRIVERNGAYLSDCSVEHEGPWVEHAKGKENAEKLWALSEELVGEKFEI